MRRLLLVSLFLLACGSDSGKPVGEPCQNAAECAGGICDSFACTATCTGAGDCPDGFACGTRPDGARLCLVACETDPGFGQICADGAPVACEQATDPASHCAACGCGEGQFCDFESNACQPARAVGAECSEPEQCASGNCGFREGVASRCLVGRGQTCTPGAGDCFSCDPTVDGDICAQTCRNDLDCQSGETCIGYQGDGFFTCRQLCSQTTCPAFWPCRVSLPENYCEPATRCDSDQDCGLNPCDDESGLCGILFD